MKQTKLPSAILKPVADEMFPEPCFQFFEVSGDNMEELSVHPNPFMLESGIEEKAVHADFFNKFDDLFDDDDLE